MTHPNDVQRRPAGEHKDGIHIAYVMWHFPLLSETFIQREIAALRERGIRITVVADAIVDSLNLGEPARRLARDAVAILPLDPDRLGAFRRDFAEREQRRLRACRAHLERRRFHDRRDEGFRDRVFDKAVYIAGVCRELGITHVHAPWSDLNAVTGMLAARLLRLPFSVQSRAHDIHRHSYRHGLAHVYRGARLVITNTEYNAACLRRRHPPVAAKITRIYNGLPLSSFPWRAPGKPRVGPLRLLCVARLIEQKGIDDLLRVSAALRAGGVDHRLVVVGGPEAGCETHHEYLLGLRCELSLEECVEFVGEASQAEVLSHYRDADLFVLPSRIAADGSRDVIPNAVIEAMACGVPVIATRVTGIPEIIDDGLNGVLREAGDVDGIAEAVKSLATDPGRMEALSRRAREKVEQRFDIDRNIDAYVDAFRRVARRSRHSRP